jgi:hypothetical protein
MARVRLDLNNPTFQKDLLGLQREEALAVLASLRRISAMEWPALYQDRGLRWEAIHSRRPPDGGRIYSLRMTKRLRALAHREGDFLKFLSLHPDHDSAYA